MSEQTEKQKLQIEHWLTKWAIAKKEPWAFVQDFACTMDEHDFTKDALNKPFPNKVYLRVVVRLWRDFDMVFVEKSRQIMMTWLMCALYLWFAMFHPGKRFFIQSKKDEYAEIALIRVKHILERILTFGLPGIPEPKKVGSALGTTSLLEFPKIKSEIRALPQGGDQMRSMTWTGGLSDESEFQPEFGDSQEAYAPTHVPSNRMWSVSTVNGKGEVYELLYAIDPVTDKQIGERLVDSAKVKSRRFIPPKGLTPEQERYWIEETIINLSDKEFDAIPIHELVAECPGMRYWQNSDGGHSLRIHHTADPEKDPITQKGREWKTYMLKTFRGNKQRWAKEMDMKRNVYEGRPVISNWNPDVFVRPVTYNSDYPLELTFDFGAQVCLCFFGQYIMHPVCREYQLKISNELVLRGLESNTPTLAKETVRISKENYYRSWENGRVVACCDPNGDRAEATTSDATLESHVKILQAHGIFPSTKKFSVKQSTENMETAFWKTLSNGEPAVLIDPRCTYLIECLEGGLHYPKNNKGREGHYEKDGKFDHGGDGVRYLINNKFSEFELASMPEPKVQVVRQRYRRFTGERLGPATEMSRGVHAVRS